MTIHKPAARLHQDRIAKTEKLILSSIRISLGQQSSPWWSLPVQGFEVAAEESVLGVAGVVAVLLSRESVR